MPTSEIHVIAIPQAAGVASHWGVLLSPAGDVLMSLSTVIVAVNAKFLEWACHVLASPEQARVAQ